MSSKLEAAHGMYDYQRQVYRDILESLRGESRSRQNGGRVVAHLPTGAGKTRIACHVASALLSDSVPENRLVVWLAASEELCDQAAEALTAAWQSLGNRDVGMYRFYGGEASDLTRAREGFIVAGLPKLYAAYRRETGFLTSLASRSAGLIFDEAHQAVARTYQEMTESIAAYDTPVLGLTATPGRTREIGERDVALAELFDDRKVNIDPKGHPDPVTYLISQGYLAEPNFEHVEVTLGVGVREPTGEREYRESDLQAVGRDQQWQDKVYELATTALGRHNRVMVFCPSVQCSEVVAHRLSQDGINASSIVASTDQGRRADIIEGFRGDSRQGMVLLNYGVLTAGFDAPRTSCVIVARPTTSLVLYCQMIGRAMRGPLSKGTQSCQIYTVVDPNLKGFGSVVEAHTNWEALWRSSNK